MTTGWRIVATSPQAGAAAPLQTWLLIAHPDKEEAVRAAKARYPTAELRVDSQADAEAISKYGVQAGEVFVLVEGS